MRRAGARNCAYSAGKANTPSRSKARIFHLHPLVLHRFIEAIRNALRGIFMGIIFVAIIQGFLCGVGFAIVGYKQFAFWGLLASFVAPIPTVGTALVWGPLSLQLWFSGQTVEAVTLVLWGVIIVIITFAAKITIII